LSLEDTSYPHVPTGLYIAGFLANAGMLKVDQEVQVKLREHRVAHFRFVDDHIVLAYTMDELIVWLKEYAEILKRSGTGVRINRGKVLPEKELANFFLEDLSPGSNEDVTKRMDQVKKKCRL